MALVTSTLLNMSISLTTIPSVIKERVKFIVSGNRKNIVRRVTIER